MDYCSYWFEGWWAHCCQIHDLAYDLQEIAPSVADWELMQCVTGVGAPFIGGIMLIGLGLFGRKAWRRAKAKKEKRDDIEI